MLPVASSSIAAIGYDAEARVLTVQFVSGAIYDYAGVSLDDYEALRQADSIGSHFASHIKNQPWRYPYSKRPAEAPTPAADSFLALHQHILTLERAHADLLARFEALEAVVYHLENRL